MTTRIRLHRGMQRGLWGARAGALLAASMLVGSACATGTSSMAPGASSTPSAPGASGSPSTPVVFVTTGTLVEARMWHAASRLADGRVLVIGGVIETGDAVASAELYDPLTGSFVATGSMTARRQRPTATLLENGRVLVTGGGTKSTTIASAELYDPAAGTFTATGSLATARIDATATLLADGRVLVVGGNDGGVGMLASAELYDPAAGTFTATGSLATARGGHTATLLADGRVLIVGGSTASAELYDPAAGTFSPTGSLTTERSWHTSTLLADGRVLVAGGRGESAELYDPATGAFALTGSMSVSREEATATLLDDGRVLVVGGSDGQANGVALVELYDPGSGAFTAPGRLTTVRTSDTATRLKDGRVLVVGGGDATLNVLASAELFSPGGTASASPGPSATPASTPSYPGTFTPTGSLGPGRAWHTATRLSDGRVVVVGGSTGGSVGDPTAGSRSLASAKIYDPTTGAFAPTGSLATARARHTATLLADGRVLVVGGREERDGDAGKLASAELYDPTTGAFTPTGSLAVARSGHAAVLLADRRVLVIGGGPWDASNVTSTFAELYDPATATFARTGSLPGSFNVDTVTLLQDGRVLVLGSAMGAAGNAGGTPPVLAAAQLYDPATGSFARTGSPDMPAGAGDLLAGHTATLLADGRVVVIGGVGSQVSSQVYDPATGTFTVTGSLIAQRAWHTATRLADGRVLVVGGDGGSGALAYSELYDPPTGSFIRTGPLTSARAGHTATVLEDGGVLAAGGEGALGGPGLAAAEVYR